MKKLQIIFLIFIIGNVFVFSSLKKSQQRLQIRESLLQTNLEMTTLENDDIQQITNTEMNEIAIPMEDEFQTVVEESTCKRTIKKGLKKLKECQNMIIVTMAICMPILLDSWFLSHLLFLMNLILFIVNFLVNMIENALGFWFSWSPAWLKKLSNFSRKITKMIQGFTIGFSFIYLLAFQTTQVTSVFISRVWEPFAALITLFLKGLFKCFKHLLKKLFGHHGGHHHHGRHNGHHHGHHQGQHHGQHGHQVHHHHLHHLLHQNGAHVTSHTNALHNTTNVAHHVATTASHHTAGLSKGLVVNAAHGCSGKVVAMSTYKTTFAVGAKTSAVKGAGATLFKGLLSGLAKLGIGTAVAHGWPIILPFMAIGGVAYLCYKNANEETIVKKVNITEGWENDIKCAVDDDETGKPMYLYGATVQNGTEISSVYVSNFDVLTDLVKKFESQETNQIIDDNLEVEYEFITEQLDTSNFQGLDDEERKTEIETYIQEQLVKNDKIEPDLVENLPQYNYTLHTFMNWLDTDPEEYSTWSMDEQENLMTLNPNPYVYLDPDIKDQLQRQARNLVETIHETTEEYKYEDIYDGDYHANVKRIDSYDNNQIEQTKKEGEQNEWDIMSYLKLTQGVDLEYKKELAHRKREFLNEYLLKYPSKKDTINEIVLDDKYIHPDNVKLLVREISEYSDDSNNYSNREDEVEKFLQEILDKMN